MSNNYQIFEELLKDITTATRFNDEEISVIVGRNPGYIAQLRSRFKHKAEDVPQKFIERLIKHFAIDDMRKHIDNKTLLIPMGAKKINEEIKEDLKNATIDMRSFDAIINTNELLAEGYRNLTLTHKDAIQTNAKMVDALITANVPKETDLTYQDKLAEIIERLAVGLIGKAWNTRAEGLKELGKVLSGKKQADLQ